MSRPHCQQPDACKAKKPGRHCPRCTALSPAGRLVRARTMKANAAKAWGNPDSRARMVAATAARNSVQSPLCQALAKTPENKAKRIRAKHQGMFGWCPDSRYPEYRDLVDRKHIKSTDAKQMILESMERERARAAEEVARNAAEMRARHERDLAQRY